MSLSALGARFPAMFEPLEGCRYASRNCGCPSDERTVSWLLGHRADGVLPFIGSAKPLRNVLGCVRSNGHARSIAMKGERRKEEVTPLQYWFTIEDNTSTEAPNRGVGSLFFVRVEERPFVDGNVALFINMGIEIWKPQPPIFRERFTVVDDF